MPWTCKGKQWTVDMDQAPPKVQKLPNHHWRSPIWGPQEIPDNTPTGHSPAVCGWLPDSSWHWRILQGKQALVICLLSWEPWGTRHQLKRPKTAKLKWLIWDIYSSEESIDFLKPVKRLCLKYPTQPGMLESHLRKKGPLMLEVKCQDNPLKLKFSRQPPSWRSYAC